MISGGGFCFESDGLAMDLVDSSTGNSALHAWIGANGFEHGASEAPLFSPTMLHAFLQTGQFFQQPDP